MALRCVLAGSAEAVRAAETLPGLRALRLAPVGAVIIGAGEGVHPVLARTAAWEAFQVPADAGEALVLAERPPTGAVARIVLARAAEARMKVFLCTGGEVRRLRLDDLVGRPISEFDRERARALIAGKRIMITGGGGSIGAELARQVAGLGAERLTLVDFSEYNLFKAGLDVPTVTLALADIRDAAAMHRWFTRERPQIVFHAAALKHVPLVEAFPCEGVRTNICGLRNVAEAAQEANADFVFVSTDKAAEPSGVMGATKRFGELYCQALDRIGAQRFAVVRLGNVLASSGSVAPVLERQLAAGGPLTVTHPDVTRFFVTIPQAADSILQASLAALESQALPRGVALAMDMGEALSVAELAREVIRLEGLRPDVDVRIVFTGLRPGEKLHEVLLGGDEQRAPDPAPGVLAAASAPRGLAELHAAMERLAMLARQDADEAVRAELFAALDASPAIRGAADAEGLRA